MSQTTPTYTAVTRRGNRTTYELTLAEVRIIEWIRHEANNGHDWTGTIRYVSGANIYQIANHVKAGQITNGK